MWTAVELRGQCTRCTDKTRGILQDQRCCGLAGYDCGSGAKSIAPCLTMVLHHGVPGMATAGDYTGVCSSNSSYVRGLKEQHMHAWTINCGTGLHCCTAGFSCSARCGDSVDVSANSSGGENAFSSELKHTEQNSPGDRWGQLQADSGYQHDTPGPVARQTHQALD